MGEQFKAREGTVLTVPNRHIEVSGKPPELEAKGCYTAYFENCYGEQLVFQFDKERKVGTLWHGDCGWEKPIQVMSGGTTMILSYEEKEWLMTVWQVATINETKEFHHSSAIGLSEAYRAICGRVEKDGS